jgi:hypothetical protein
MFQKQTNFDARLFTSGQWNGHFAATTESGSADHTSTGCGTGSSENAFGGLKTGHPHIPPKAVIVISDDEETIQNSEGAFAAPRPSPKAVTSPPSAVRCSSILNALLTRINKRKLAATSDPSANKNPPKEQARPGKRRSNRIKEKYKKTDYCSVRPLSAKRVEDLPQAEGTIAFSGGAGGPTDRGKAPVGGRFATTHPSGGRQQWPPAIVGTNIAGGHVGSREAATGPRDIIDLTCYETLNRPRSPIASINTSFESLSSHTLHCPKITGKSADPRFHTRSFINKSTLSPDRGCVKSSTQKHYLLWYNIVINIGKREKTLCCANLTLNLSTITGSTDCHKRSEVNLSVRDVFQVQRCCEKITSVQLETVENEDYFAYLDTIVSNKQERLTEHFIKTLISNLYRWLLETFEEIIPGFIMLGLHNVIFKNKCEVNEIFKKFIDKVKTEYSFYYHLDGENKNDEQFSTPPSEFLEGMTASRLAPQMSSQGVKRLVTVTEINKKTNTYRDKALSPVKGLDNHLINRDTSKRGSSPTPPKVMPETADQWINELLNKPNS